MLTLSAADDADIRLRSSSPTAIACSSSSCIAGFHRSQTYLLQFDLLSN
jgi:hypothetical protein